MKILTTIKFNDSRVWFPLSSAVDNMFMLNMCHIIANRRSQATQIHTHTVIIIIVLLFVIKQWHLNGCHYYECGVIWFWWHNDYLCRTSCIRALFLAVIHLWKITIIIKIKLRKIRRYGISHHLLVKIKFMDKQIVTDWKIGVCKDRIINFR